jgi:hypothetical protein
MKVEAMTPCDGRHRNAEFTDAGAAQFARTVPATSPVRVFRQV